MEHARFRSTKVYTSDATKYEENSFCMRLSDPQTDVAPGRTRGRNVRSKNQCSMCPAIHTKSRSWLRSSSTREPSDPLLRVVFWVFFFRSNFSIRSGSDPIQRSFGFPLPAPRRAGRSSRKLFLQSPTSHPPVAEGLRSSIPRGGLRELSRREDPVLVLLFKPGASPP